MYPPFRVRGQDETGLGSPKYLVASGVCGDI